MICEYGDNFEPRFVVNGEGTVVTAENYCVVVGGWRMDCSGRTAFRQKKLDIVSNVCYHSGKILEDLRWRYLTRAAFIITHHRYKQDA